MPEPAVTARQCVRLSLFCTWLFALRWVLSPTFLIFIERCDFENEACGSGCRSSAIGATFRSLEAAPACDGDLEAHPRLPLGQIPH
jgi:hypothetical protein